MMDEQHIKEILQLILDRLQNQELVWRLEGSANLKIQGIDVWVRDLDITTNDHGIQTFRNALQDYKVKDSFNQNINGYSLVFNIHDFEVEVNSYGNKQLNMFDKIEIILWNNLHIPILPLKYAKRFYEFIDRKEKADLLSQY